ncbi:efflux RND transporter permease subunit [Patescibacteria group bacterium]|nr:efflux RND transporter permease subunit [Patescibacteria group bacterium]
MDSNNDYKYSKFTSDTNVNGFWSFFVKNWRVTMLAIGSIGILGVFSLFSLPIESQPEVKIPIAIVSTAYPGASPADIEKLVTDKLEDKLKNLNNLNSISSSSTEGVSSITIEFEASANLTESIRDLRDEVDNAKNSLPDDASDPVVIEISLSDSPIIAVSLLANLPPDDLKRYGEDLQDMLEGMSGVSEVLLSGLESEEMQILVDIQKLEGYGISLSSIVNVISSNHIDFPVGSILTDGYYYQASIKGQFDSAEDLLALPIATRGNQNVFLRDVAEVREAFSESTSQARIYTSEDNAYNDSITLQVKKKTGANITEMTTKVKTEVEKYKTENLPPNIKILITNDESEYIREDIQTLGRSGLQTVFIIFAVLFLALGIKEALLVGLTVPLIFLLAFIGLSFVGETLNTLVLFSLILSLGLIVDTSIVIMEGVYEYVKERGMNGRDAALAAIKTYRAPLISGTLTTVAVFFPMMLMTGIMGEFTKHIPITIVLTLFSSLFIAIFLLSAVAAHVFKNHDHENAKKKNRKPYLSYLVDPLRKWYLEKIRIVLNSKNKKRVWVLGMLISFVASMMLPIAGILKVEMFPKIDLGYFNVNIELPSGAKLEETSGVTETVEKMVEELPEVDNFLTIIGKAGSSSSSRLSGAGGGAGSNVATITVNLNDKETRDLKSYEIADILRENIKTITDAKVEVREIAAGPPSGAPIEIEITGENIDSLNASANTIINAIESIPGTRDVTSNTETGTGEFHFTLKRDQLNYYGVTATSVAMELRTAVYGNNSIKILRNGKETPITIALDFRTDECKNDKQTKLLEIRDRKTICRNAPQDIAQIKNLQIQTPKGTIPVSDLADIELFPAITTIRHKETNRVLTVSGYTEIDVLAVEVIQQFEEKAKTLNLPLGITWKVGGEQESTMESFQSLGQAMILGIFMIVVILVLQFNSYRQPLIILMTLPLSLIGVFVGLALLGRNFSFPGFIGIVALAGVVVNDAIVLIDRINQNIRNGVPKLESVIISGGERLQPIILTTVTTAAGVLPLAFTNEMWGDLAWTIAIGITCSTILTLVMVPIFYNAIVNEEKVRDIF